VTAVVRRLVSLLVIVAVLAGGGLLVRARLLAGARPAGPVYATAKAFRGTMTADVAGYGPLQPAFFSNLQAPAAGTVVQVLAQVGDTVHKGQVIAVLSNPGLAAKIAQDRARLEEDERILATTLGVPQDQALAAAGATGGVTVTAPQAGRVVAVKVGSGDAVTQGQQLVQIVDDAQVTVAIDLLPYDHARVAAGDAVRVHFDNFSGEVDGVLTQVSANPAPAGIGSSGAPASPYLVYPAVITLPNPGLLAPGMTGEVTVQTANGWVDLTETATVQGYGRQDSVSSPIAGTVAQVLVQPNAWVSRGQPLLSIGGAAAASAIATLAANVQQDQANLEADQQQLDSLTVRSDIDGRIANLNVRPGMTVNQGWFIGNIFDNSRMTLNIQVNELQVANVKQGQDVLITAPGLPGRTFHGQVASVASMGQSQNGGLATFAVQIAVDGTSDLKPGMTADAHIVVATVPDALLVPVEAVVAGGGGQPEVEVLRGGQPVFVPVQVGLVNDQYAQITSGLQAGEVVITGMAGGNAAPPAGPSAGNPGATPAAPAPGKAPPATAVPGKAAPPPAPAGK
jgi:HlyD family secretion protein